LSEDEIKRMQKEAETHKADDEKRKQVVNAHNTLDGLVYSIEKTLKENGDKIEAATKTQVEEALVEARKKLDSTDVEVLQKATEALTSASNKMAEQMYKNAGAQAGGPGAGDNGAPGGPGGEDASHNAHSQGHAGAGDKKGDDVIDADFKEV
jgi:molecular chaperone DnaK